MQQSAIVNLNLRRPHHAGVYFATGKGFMVLQVLPAAAVGSIE